MIPYLHIGSFNLPTFGLMLWLAAVVGAIVADRAFKRGAHRRGCRRNGGCGAGREALLDRRFGMCWIPPSEFREIGWRVLWITQDLPGMAD